MEFQNNNDVLIQLNLQDRRGRKVRVSEVKDLKIKVWTHNPDCALTLGARDVREKRDHDDLFISGLQMSALQSGVINYSYSFFIPEEHGHIHEVRSGAIITDIFWRNRQHDMVIESPSIFHNLEVLRDMIEGERKERIRNDKDIKHYISEEYTNQLKDEIDRATYKEEQLEDSINEVKTTSENNYNELRTKLEEEVKRSNQVDIEMFKYIKEVEEKTAGNKAETEEKIVESDKRAQEAEKELQASIDAEKARAKSEESRIEEKLDAEIARSKAEDTQTTLDLNAEVTRAKGEEARIEARMEAEKSRAKDAEEKLKASIEDEVARSKAADEKTAKKQEELKDSFEELKTTVLDEIRRSQQFDEDCEKMCKKSGDEIEALKTALEEEVARAKKKENNIKKAVENEVSRATIKENELEASTKLLETKVDANAENIKSETSRAQLVEKDLADSIQALKQTVLNKDQSYNDQFQELLNKLNAEENARQIKDEDLQRLIDILNGDEFTVGSVAHSIKDAEHRIGDVLEDLKHEVDEIIGGNLEDYATKDYVDNRFEKLVGTAPEALDTLEEIAERLQRDDDLHKALQELLSKKANKEDVYTKQEVDALTGDLQNSINAEAQRAQLAEDGLQTQITTNLGEIATVKEKVQSNTEAIQEEVTRAKTAEQAISGTLTNLSNDYELFKDKVNQHIAEGDTNYSELNKAIIEEQTRAQNEETKLQNQLDIINGDETTPGSIKHAIEDAKHYTDDEIEKVKHVVDTVEDNLSAHVDQANQRYEEVKEELEGKQERGDYVAYTTGEDGRKHVILPNNVNIVGTLQDGTDGRNLIMLSKWNVVDIGSVNTPVNLNGLNERPTYNDKKELALLEDVEKLSQEKDAEIADLKKRLEVLEAMLTWAVYE